MEEGADGGGERVGPVALGAEVGEGSDSAPESMASELVDTSGDEDAGFPIYDADGRVINPDGP